MRVADFDFELPPERIALRPAFPRESAKMLVVGDGLADLTMGDLPGQLRAGDVLVFNNTKVIPAALRGVRVGRLGTTPKIEALLHMRIDERRWKAFAKPAKKLEAGDRLEFGVLHAMVEEKGESGEITLLFDVAGEELFRLLHQEGRMPLPPYIESKRAQDEKDRSDYQTSFAKTEGAVAAPTAGLHFTPELIKRLQVAGIESEFLTLHVGAGTFLPVKADDTKDHKMHSEWGEISSETAARLKQVRASGGRIVAVGTTSLRLLESAGLEEFSGTTDIFITPGYAFRAVDGLITNFHLPRSTLFMLVSAFAGLERMKQAYAHAISSEYRFYSYGDGSLIWPQK
ncbi:tRNA preQ1(34) S-adenosylmethionine ribosyltransferase-isomerase QueA [Aestuariivirga litoralis]|uniref:tRNA preQ1(34) S-adenosylmethionine ribosyltransferase-isomerase QueA n=1 Tax=Aestuariivirga litoralis TaxID=2650924 RepID=UPI0018C56861|nr:tRNA preQ1(34) S-adenosylmethionine ribosyltransferase-isomerase QueA [Aestuariivirga litoralis]MBG1231414.1 tRNA preQ1(34) S-adenosylmethionine ribosyltransferase-isomerase QueA [Aestuariivirga litoralis]